MQSGPTLGTFLVISRTVLPFLPMMYLWSQSGAVMSANTTLLACRRGRESVSTSLHSFQMSKIRTIIKQSRNFESLNFESSNC